MRKEIISIIHGVDSLAEWYPAAQSALSPHFELRPFRYTSFQRLGKLKVVMEPWTLAFGLFILVALPFLKIGLFSKLLLAVMDLFSLPVSIWLAGRSRRKIVVKYQEDLSNVPSGERPHVIAHSFGTFIGCHSLREYPQRAYGKVILAGCVLPVDFDWGALKNKYHGGAFREVRNEVSSNDPIGFLTRAARKIGLSSDFGEAGVRGFTPSEFVHDLPSPWHRCNLCKGGDAALVHNVKVEMSHSGTLTGTGFIETFWLPFLWDIHPSEYRDFLEICFKLARHQHRDSNDFRSARETFLNREWGWAGATGAPRRRITDLICTQIAARVFPGEYSSELVESLAEVAAEMAWKAVAKASQSSVSSNSRRHLDPKFAAFDAAKRVLAHHIRRERQTR